MSGGEDKIKQLYDALSQDKDYKAALPDENTFRNTLSDTQKATDFYTTLREDKDYAASLPATYEEFSAHLGLQKKNSTPEQSGGSGASGSAAPFTSQNSDPGYTATVGGQDAKPSAERFRTTEKLEEGTINYLLKNPSKSAEDVYFSQLKKLGVSDSQLIGLRQKGAAAKKYAPAIEELTGKVNADPKDINSSQDLGNIYSELGQYDKADQLYANVLSNKPDSHEALNGLAFTQAKRGDYSNAISLYQQAFDKSIDNSANHPEYYADMGALKNLIILKAKIGDKTGADKDYARYGQVAKQKGELQYLAGFKKDVDDIAQGKGVFALFNPVGAISASIGESGLSAVEKFKEAGGDFSHGEKTAAALKTLSGLGSIVMGIGMGASPSGMAFGAASQALPPEAQKPFMQPVTALRELVGISAPDSDIGKSIEELANTVGGVAVLHGVTSAIEKAPIDIKETLDKVKDGAEVSPDLAKQAAEYIREAPEVKEAMRAVNEIELHDKHSQSIPERITDPQTRVEASKLLEEKQSLEQSIDGKDKALTMPEQERIKEINDKLTEISNQQTKPNEKTNESTIQESGNLQEGQGPGQEKGNEGGVQEGQQNGQEGVITNGGGDTAPINTLDQTAEKDIPETGQEAPQEVVPEAEAIKEVTTQEKLDEIKQRREEIKARISQKVRASVSANSGPKAVLDIPIRDAIELGSTYVEEGYVRFADWAKRFASDYKEITGGDVPTGYAERVFNSVSAKPAYAEARSKIKSLIDKGSVKFEDSSRQRLVSDFQRYKDQLRAEERGSKTGFTEGVKKTKEQAASEKALVTEVREKIKKEINYAKANGYLNGLSEHKASTIFKRIALADDIKKVNDALDYTIDAVDKNRLKIEAAELAKQPNPNAKITIKDGVDAPGGINRDFPDPSQSTDPAIVEQRIKKFPSWLAYIRDAVSYNLSQTKAYSEIAKDAIVEYAASSSQAAVIIKKAVAEINKVGGPGLWEELRKGLMESRLRGVRQRWYSMAQEMGKSTEQDLLNSFENGLGDLLDNIESRIDGKNAKDTIAALLTNGHIETAKDYLSDTFKLAGDNVASMDFGANTYEQVIEQPKFKEALKIYKNLVEKEIAASHENNEGVFSDSLGDLDTYYPLIPKTEPHKSAQKKYSNLSKPRNAGNNFATGLSKDYDTSVEGLADKLQKSIKANNKASMLNVLEEQGLIQKLGPKDPVPETIDINGDTYKAMAFEVAPFQRIIVPSWLYSELKPLVEAKDIDEKDISKIMNVITKYALGGPMEASIHSANLIGGVANGTPYAGTSWLSKTIGNTPVTKILTSIVNVLAEDVTSEASIVHMQDMAKNGLLSSKTAKVTNNKAIAEATGAKYVPRYNIFDFSTALYGDKGIDLKARVLMDRVALEINPDATPEERREFSNQLGNYVKGLEGSVERSMKNTGIAPFYTAGSTFIRNGLKSLIGATPLPTKGLSLQQRIGYRAAQLASNGVIGALSFWVLAYKAQTGKLPWDDEKARMLELPVPDEVKSTALAKALFYRDGKWGNISMSFANPILSRGIAATGIKNAFNAKQAGANGGQMVEEAARGMINSASGLFMSAPATHFAMTATLGKSPYITSLRDQTGTFTPQMLSNVEAQEQGFPQIGANIAQAAIKTNPIASGLAEVMGFSFTPKYKDTTPSDGVTDATLQMVFDMGFPRLYARQVDLIKMKSKFRKQAAAVKRKTNKSDENTSRKYR